MIDTFVLFTHSQVKLPLGKKVTDRIPELSVFFDRGLKFC